MRHQRSQVPSKSPRLTGGQVGIPPRQLDFALPDRLPPWALADNATATLFLAMLSAVFPPGEDFFVQSVVHYRDRVTDPELRARVAGFTGQEVIHSREHDRLNQAFEQRGFDVAAAEAIMAFALDRLRRTPARWQIGATAMMEHFTAVFAEELLARQDFRDALHPDIAELWLWHALEELEHKSVTYDVYDIVGNTRRERMRATALVVAFVAPAAVLGWARLMYQQRVWRRRGDVAEGMRLLFGAGGYLRDVLRRMPVFHRDDFHPDRHDTTALEAHWRDRLFGTDGSLAGQLRRPPR